MIGILPHEAVPQGGLYILVIDHGGQLFCPDGLQPPAHRLGDDAAEGQALDAVCQQTFQRRQVCLRITGGGEFQQSLHAVLLGIGDAAVDALHDLLLEVRFTEGYQHADLVLFPGEVEGPAQGVRLEVQLRHYGPHLFRRFRLYLAPVVQDPVHGTPGYTGLGRDGFNACRMDPLPWPNGRFS